MGTPTIGMIGADVGSGRTPLWSSSGWLHPYPRAFGTALAVSAAALLVLGWLTFVSVPSVQLGLERRASGEWSVGEVPVAESAWLYGVRAGMVVDGFTGPGSTPGQGWESLAVTDGTLRLDVQRHLLAPEAIAFTGGLIALLLAVVAYRLAPTLAWWLTVAPTLTSLAVASDYVPASLAFLLALAPPAVAGLSVAERARRLHPLVPALAAMAVLGAAAGWLVAYSARFESWALPRQLPIGVAVVMLGLGTVAVIREGLRRARTRLGHQGAAVAPSMALLAATVDELIPGRARSRLLAIESERTRLASDLHADVLPELADVIRSADAGMNPTETASRLRAVADELRDLMAERRLAVLDELGLVPALEWLAERIEERTKVRVEIDIRGDDAQRAPREVELAAYRIAQQAMDNALIHAHAGTIRIDLTISGQRLELEITDDGLGLPVDAEARALRAGHLGLADMRARAAAIGGTFRIGSRPGSGTTAALRWPA